MRYNLIHTGPWCVYGCRKCYAVSTTDCFNIGLKCFQIMFLFPNMFSVISKSDCSISRWYLLHKEWNKQHHSNGNQHQSSENLNLSFRKRTTMYLYSLYVSQAYLMAWGGMNKAKKQSKKISEWYSVSLAVIQSAQNHSYCNYTPFICLELFKSYLMIHLNKLGRLCVFS